MAGPATAGVGHSSRVTLGCRTVVIAWHRVWPFEKSKQASAQQSGMPQHSRKQAWHCLRECLNLRQC